MIAHGPFLADCEALGTSVEVKGSRVGVADSKPQAMLSLG
jgi:hypothetical protein